MCELLDRGMGIIVIYNHTHTHTQGKLAKLSTLFPIIPPQKTPQPLSLTRGNKANIKIE